MKMQVSLGSFHEFLAIVEWTYGSRFDWLKLRMQRLRTISSAFSHVLPCARRCSQSSRVWWPRHLGSDSRTLDLSCSKQGSSPSLPSLLPPVPYCSKWHSHILGRKSQNLEFSSLLVASRWMCKVGVCFRPPRGRVRSVAGFSSWLCVTAQPWSPL